MKKLLVVLLMAVNLVAYSKTYYVATNGNDNNPGTKAKPFATWSRLQNYLQPGDTGYIRGGKYNMPKWEWFSSGNTFQHFNGLKGTKKDTIKIWNYPGETPVFDLTGVTEPRNTSFLLHVDNCAYLWFRGLRITNAHQPTNGSYVYGVYVWESSHNVFENITCDHLGGSGFSVHGAWWIKEEVATTRQSRENLFLNCDAYELADPLSATPYDGSNGFQVNWTDKGNKTIFRGCRAWNVCDDGWDFYNNTSDSIYIDQCWSFNIGYYNGSQVSNSGNGFKLGVLPSSVPSDNYVGYIVTNCIAANNPMSGFTCYGTSPEDRFYNNIAYKNGYIGFFTWGEGDAKWTLCNNISFSPANDASTMAADHWGDHRYWAEEANAWDNFFKFSPPNKTIDVKESDFISLDLSELTNERQANGSLPAVECLHLSPESPLVDAGVYVGIPFGGEAPDLGPFEIFKGSEAKPVTFVSSEVENASPQFVSIKFDQPLASVVPDISSFTISVNKMNISVTSISVDGAEVNLKLAKRVNGGDVITISYSKPSGSFLQNVYGVEAISFVNQPVINHVKVISSTDEIDGNQKPHLAIFPNPAKEYFVLQISNINIEPSSEVVVYDISGRICLERNIEGNNMTLFIPEYMESGVYLIQVKSGNIIYGTEKMVIRK